MPSLKYILTAVLFAVILHAGTLPEYSSASEHSTGNAASNTSFTKFYNTINALINAKNWTELNKYVHPDYGFYIYDNPGVRTVATNYRKFDELTDTEGKKDEVVMNKMRDLKVDLKHKLISGKVPSWDCGKDKWNKKGSYCQDLSSYPGLSENVLWSSGNEDNPNQPQVIKAKAFGKLIRKHVIQTDGYDMYFAFIDGAWYIAVIDLCDKCSA